MRKDLYEISAVTLVGLFLRLYGLDANSFHWDELQLMFNADKPLGSINTVFPPPLFPYLLRLLSLGPVQGEFLRLLPALLGAAFVPLVYAVVRREKGHEAGLWGAFIAALSPIHLFHSQDLTMYTLVMLEALLALFLWDRLLEKGRFWDYVCYSLVMIAGFQTHPWFAFVFLSHAVWLLFFTPPSHSFRLGLYAVITVALVSAELQPDSFFHFHTPYFFWLKQPDFSAIVKTAQAFLFGIAPPLGTWNNLSPMSAAGFLAFFLLIAAAGTFHSTGPWTRRARLLFTGFLGPLSIGFAFSHLVTPVYYAENHAVVAFPGFLVLVSGVFAAGGKWPRRLSRGIGGLYCLLCAFVLVFYFTTFDKAPWKSMGRLLDSLPKPAYMDTSALKPFERASLRYYAGDRRDLREAPAGGSAEDPFRHGTPASLFVPARMGAEESVLAPYSSSWRIKRVVYLNDFVVYLFDKRPPARGLAGKPPHG